MCIRDRSKRTPPASALPLTRHVMLALVHYLRCNREPVVAAALATAWGGYLRASEVLNLSWTDIALKGDTRTRHLSQCIVGLNIKDAKTGPLQFTAIRDKTVQDILHRYSSVMQRTGKAFPITYSRYLGKLKEAASFFGLPGSLTPHSARIGGALHDYCNGMEASSIAIHGRWESLKSLRHYLSNGRAFIQAIKLTSTQQNKISEFASATEEFLLNGEANFSQACNFGIPNFPVQPCRAMYANNSHPNSSALPSQSHIAHSTGMALKRYAHSRNRNSLFPAKTRNLRNTPNPSKYTGNPQSHTTSARRKRDWREALSTRKDRYKSLKQRRIYLSARNGGGCKKSHSGTGRDWRIALRKPKYID